MSHGTTSLTRWLRSVKVEVVPRLVTPAQEVHLQLMQARENNIRRSVGDSVGLR